LAVLGNAMVMQSGGSTPVLNRSLYGIFREACLHREIGNIYGADHALDGVIAGRLYDLRGQSRDEWEAIAATPGAALGSSRRKLKPDDVPVVLELVERLNIRYWFIIGGNDSADTGNRLSIAARDAGIPLSVINVPKTIDNDLVSMDHTPGYGSAARFVAIAAMGAGRDAETMGREAPITVIEVMGRDAGWLAAAGALARREERDAPHVVCIPESAVDEDRFVELIEASYRKNGFAVAVVAENARGKDGVLGKNKEPWYVDDFGHAYYEGAGRHLASLVGMRLRVRVRYEKPGTIQRSMASTYSTADTSEAEIAGRAAVKAAIAGETGKIVTLLREQGSGYQCTTGLALLMEVANAVKRMPAEYYDPATCFPTAKFIEYAMPLVGESLPRFGRVR